MATMLTLPGADPIEMSGTADADALAERLSQAIVEGHIVPLMTADGARLVVNGKTLEWFRVERVEARPLQAPFRIR